MRQGKTSRLGELFLQGSRNGLLFHKFLGKYFSSIGVKFPNKSLNPKTNFSLTSYWCKELEVSVAEIGQFEWRGKHVEFSESFLSPGKAEAACLARDEKVIAHTAWGLGAM